MNVSWKVCTLLVASYFSHLGCDFQKKAEAYQELECGKLVPLNPVQILTSARTPWTPLRPCDSRLAIDPVHGFAQVTVSLPLDVTMACSFQPGWKWPMSLSPKHSECIFNSKSCSCHLLPIQNSFISTRVLVAGSVYTLWGPVKKENARPLVQKY